jgi:Phosphotransferase enzyme family
VIDAPIAGDLQPLANESLRARFPQLAAALDPEIVRSLLQAALFPGGTTTVEACEKPRAEVGEDSCWLQYTLTVRTASGARDRQLVFGTMFVHAAQAASFEREVLTAQAERLPQPSEGPQRTAVLEPLGTALSVFPVNGAFPGLIDAIDPDQVAALLARRLPTRPAVQSVELVELRRTRGCVLRYRLDSAEHAVVYGKLGRTVASDAVRDGLEALAANLRTRGNGSVYFPRGLGRSATLGLTLVSEIPGRRPDLKDASDRERALDGAALVAASLHGAPVRVGAVRTLNDEVLRAVEAVRLVARDAPQLADSLTRVVDAVRCTPAQSQEARFAHGSFAPSQLMLDGSRIGILDFDRLCQAEPAFDLGRFLAPLRVSLAKVDGAEADEPASRFLEGYAEHGGVSTPPERVELYECVALVRMAARSWLQLKESRLRAVLRILEARSAHLGLMA